MLMRVVMRMAVTVIMGVGMNILFTLYIGVHIIIIAMRVAAVVAISAIFRFKRSRFMNHF
jgi:hypothetical protein